VSYLRKLAKILKGIADEIADQNAYRRHLAAHGAEASGAEWRRFCDERWATKAKQGKCC